MSKSLGNGIDPIEMIDKYGTDAVRSSLIMLTAEGQDVQLASSKFEMGRNFCNKIWNVYRFLMMNLVNYEPIDIPPLETLELADKWILSRYNHTIQQMQKSLELYRLNEAMHKLYDFVWHDFCDWYLELIKERLRTDDYISQIAKTIALKVFEGTLRLLHPVMPFITEEIWQNLPIEKEEISIMISKMPEVNSDLINEEIENQLQLIQEIIRSIRNLRAEMNIPLGKTANILLKVEDPHKQEVLEANTKYIHRIAKISQLTLSDTIEIPKIVASAVVMGVEIYLPLEDLIDVKVEKSRLQKKIDKLQNDMMKLEKKLNNEDFLKKAPRAVIMKNKGRYEKMKEDCEKLQKQLERLVKS